MLCAGDVVSSRSKMNTNNLWPSDRRAEIMFHCKARLRNHRQPSQCGRVPIRHMNECHPRCFLSLLHLLSIFIASKTSDRTTVWMVHEMHQCKQNKAPLLSISHGAFVCAVVRASGRHKTAPRPRLSTASTNTTEPRTHTCQPTDPWLHTLLTLLPFRRNLLRPTRLPGPQEPTTI